MSNQIRKSAVLSIHKMKESYKKEKKKKKRKRKRIRRSYLAIYKTNGALPQEKFLGPRGASVLGECLNGEPIRHNYNKGIIPHSKL